MTTGRSIGHQESGAAAGVLRLAQMSVRDAAPGRGVDGPEVVMAEFIHWKERPQSWDGTWPDNQVLFIINDYRAAPSCLETVNEKRHKIWVQVSHSAYNLPAKYRNRYVRMEAVDGVERLLSSLTDDDIKQLEAEMSPDEMRWWHDAMSGVASDLLVEASLSASVEYPIKARVAGLQGVEYTKVFKNIDDAKKALGALKADPVWGTLTDLGFRFEG